MPSVIQLKSGQTETVFDLDGLLYLIQQHMGDDARCLLEEYIADIEDPEQYARELEKEIEKLRSHHHEVMQELRSLSGQEARLIQEKEIDRMALSTVAGKIGTITWREMNVR